jgi:hypothetical protein
MPRVVAHPGQALDDPRHPRQSPQVGGKAVRRGAAPQGRVDPGQLPAIQTRLAAQPSSGLQAGSALAGPGMVPAAGGHRRHPQGLRHCRLGLAPGKPARRLEPARLQRGDFLFPCHASAWHRTL